MQAHNVFGALGEVSNLVQIQRRGIAGQNRAGLAVGVQSAKDFLLDAHFFKYSFDNQINVGQVGIIGYAADQRHALFQRGFVQAAALDAHAIGITGALHGLVAGLCSDFQYLDRDAGVGKAHGNAHAHGAATDHGS